MEPRPHERGNSSAPVISPPQRGASMEPRPHERGNPTTSGSWSCSTASLQWSHVLTNVETLTPAMGVAAQIFPLKGGHVPTTGETRAERGQPFDGRQAP